LNSV
jgi:hypothetical protein